MDELPLVTGFMVERDGQWYSHVASDLYGPEDDFSVELVWRSNCRVCGTLFEFGTPLKVDEGKWRKCCDKHTAPQLRIVSER